MGPMKTDALQLAELGFKLLPIAEGRKYPPLSDRQAWDDASDDLEQVEEWWDKYPDANIAWSPGMSGCTLLDIDGPEGIQTLKNLGVIFDPDRPETTTVSTPGRGGGWHLVYEKPPIDGLTKGRLGPGLEHITFHQYALMPPSSVRDGLYRWHRVKIDPTPLPPQIAELIGNGTAHHEDIGTDPADPDCRYCPAKADGILGDIANTPEGSRNDNLFYKSRCLLELPDVDHSYYMRMAADAAAQTGLSPHEINTTIHSAMRAHQLKWGAPGQGPGCQANYKRQPVVESEPPPAPPQPQPGQWMTRLINTIQPKPQTWLIDQWIPLEATSLLFGDSDKGKSTLLLHWAAEISNSQQLHTIYCTGDIDNPETSIKPKWTAAGGHPFGLSVLEDRTVNEHGEPVTPTYIHTLHHIENLIENTQQQLTHHQAPIRKVGLVILDPIENFLPGDINTHNNMQVKQALEPLSRIAQHKQCSIVFVQHLNKNEGASAKNRASGSTSFMSYVRSAMALGLNPENHDQRAVKIVKANLTPGTKKPCKVYQMKNHSWVENIGGWDTELSAPRMVFVKDAPQITATEILSADPDKPMKQLDLNETLDLIVATMDTEEILWADKLRDILTTHNKVSRRLYYQALDLAKRNQLVVEGRKPPQRGNYYLMSSTVPEDMREMLTETL